MTKKFSLFAAAALALCLVSAPAPVTAQAGGRPRSATPNPNIVSPRATDPLKPPNAPPLAYHFVPGPAAPEGKKFGNVGSIALTPQGNLIVFNRNPEIMMAEYDPSGKFLRAFNPNIAVNAHGLRVDRYGNIWAADSFMNVIWKLNPKGEPLMMLGTRGEVGPWDDAKWNGMFNQPLDVNFDADDNIYVVQSHGGTSNPPDCTYCANYSNSEPPVPQGSDPRILKFDKTGKFIASRSLAHATPQYPTIHSVIVTPKGEVWIGDRQANKIVVLDRDLKPLRTIDAPNRTSGLFLDAKGQIWLSTGMDGMVMRLDDNGKVIGWIGKAGRDVTVDPNAIGEAHYVVVTPDLKTIYIADSVNAKVHRLDAN